MCFSIRLRMSRSVFSSVVQRRGCLGLRSDVRNDLARLLEDGLAVEVVQVPAGGAGILGELVLLLVEGGERVAEEDTAHALPRALAAAEDRAGEASEACLQLRVGLDQRLVLEVRVLHGRARALVGMMELLQRRVVVLGREKLPALDAEGLGDEERLLRDLRVEREDLVQLLGREKVPEPDLAARGGRLGMVGNKPFFDLGIHAPVHPADALHEAHWVPVDVVVDHPRGVLEVQSLGEDVRGDQDADLHAALLGELRGGEAVVVGSEALYDVCTVLLRGTVHLFNTLDTGLPQVTLEVARRVGELGEDQDLLVGQRL